MKAKQILLTLLTLVLANTYNYAQCPNGNAENGTLNLWQGATGYYSTSLKNFTQPAPSTRVKVIQNTGTYSDATVNNNVDIYGGFKVPSEGNYAFRLGNNSGGAESEIMWYIFTVTQNNANFKFRHAEVLEDQNHSQKEQPSFEFFMNLTANNADPHLPKILPITASEIKDKKLYKMTDSVIVADRTNPFFKTFNSTTGAPVLYKAWQCHEFDLTDFIGDEVLICFRTKDCSQNLHFGYAYIDGLCDNWPAMANLSLNVNKFCSSPNSGLFMDGTNSLNEDRYTVTITESNDPQGNSLNPRNSVQEITLGKQAATQELKDWFTNKGGVWKCNTYYKVTLTIANGCSTENSSSQMVQYTCPPINAGRDTILCCRTDIMPCIPLGTTNTSPLPLFYNWSSNPVGLSASTEKVCINPTENTVYSLTVKDYFGCTATDEITVLFNGPLKVKLEYDPLLYLDTVPYNPIVSNCEPKIYANVTQLDCKGNPLSAYWAERQKKELKYLWNTGETTESISPRAGFEYYSVQVSNKCRYAKDTIFNVQYPSYFSTLIDSFYTPTPTTANGAASPVSCLLWFNPNDSKPYRRVFKIYEFVGTQNAPTPVPAYHAYKYEFIVYDRWGTVVQTNTARKRNGITRHTTTGFKQGQIQWDGLDDNGDEAPSGVYVCSLKLWNCSKSKGAYPFVWRPGGDCIKWKKKLFSKKHKCVKFDNRPGFVSAEAFTVTLVR
jgi:hypothetical protein